MDSTIRQQIALAALSTTIRADGEDEKVWEARVQLAAAAMTAMLNNDRSPVLAAIDQVDEAKIFTGTLVSITKEVSSTRGIVILQTGNERQAEYPKGTPLPAGQEFIRTERTDDPVGKIMANKVRPLVGHEVVVWVELQTMKNSNKVRVLRHIEDRGLPGDRD